MFSPCERIGKAATMSPTSLATLFQVSHSWSAKQRWFKKQGNLWDHIGYTFQMIATETLGRRNGNWSSPFWQVVPLNQTSTNIGLRTPPRLAKDEETKPTCWVLSYRRSLWTKPPPILDLRHGLLCRFSNRSPPRLAKNEETETYLLSPFLQEVPPSRTSTRVEPGRLCKARELQPGQRCTSWKCSSW